MPIWLRNFTFNKIKEHYEKQNEEMKKSQGGGNSRTAIKDGKVVTPDKTPSTPTYTSRASKK